MVRRRLLVSGTVQGVGYRWVCRRVAGAAGVTGWACNLSDGRVEVVLEGPHDAVAEVEAWCRVGPRDAFVAAVDADVEPPEGLRDFVVR